MSDSFTSETPATPEEDEGEVLDQPASLRYNLDSLDDYLSVGQEVAREGRLDEAIDVMREANSRFPESATGSYNLGVALFLRLKQDKDRLELWENLADDENLVSEAITALEGAVAADPKFVAAYNNLGKLYALRGRSEEAFRAWEKSLEIDENQPEVKADMDLYRNRISPSSDDLEERRLLNEGSPDAKL